MDSFNAKSIGFWIGLILFITFILIPNPEGLTNDGRLTLAVFLLMGVWWAFEALPLQVTALMPLVFFPLLGVIEIGVISKEYMNKVQFCWRFFNSYRNSKMGSSQESCFKYFEVKWLECKRHNSFFHASKCLVKYVGNEYFYSNNASSCCSVSY